MKFAKESLREMYRSQYTTLHGVGPDREGSKGSPAFSSSCTSSASLTVSSSDDDGDKGLLQKYETAKTRHLALKKQLDALGAKINQQKDVAASSLHVSKRKRVGLSRAEELYSVQLQRWSTVMQRLDLSLDRIKEQIEEGGEEGGYNSRSALTPPPRNNSNKVSSARKTKNFMTPTKPRSVSSFSNAHISSPHRISYRNSPATGKPCRVMTSSSGSATKKKETRGYHPPNILLHDDEKNSCAQLQRETGNLHEALLLKIKNVEERIAKLSTSI